VNGDVNGEQDKKSGFFFVGGGLFEVELFCGYPVLFDEPGAQIKDTATFGTEGTGWIPVPFNTFFADRTFYQHFSFTH
jgi:hypothetical protein